MTILLDYYLSIHSCNIWPDLNVQKCTLHCLNGSEADHCQL